MPKKKAKKAKKIGKGVAMISHRVSYAPCPHCGESIKITQPIGRLLHDVVNGTESEPIDG
jgi:predicted RNA-binding Zn-ribbon protein involved in translation (DUF1610 family)